MYLSSVKEIKTTWPGLWAHSHVFYHLLGCHVWATGSAEELPPRIHANPRGYARTPPGSARIRAGSARFRADSGGTAAEGLPPSQ